jgi:hypothetical protein
MGGMLPQQAMMRPNMMGGASFPGTGQMGGHPHMGAVQGMPAPGFYQGGASAGGGGMPSGAEMLQAAAAAGNPMAQQQYMLMQQRQMMMNGHGHGHGGRPPMHYPMAYPMPPRSHAEQDSIFSDENPNSCSVM